MSLRLKMFLMSLTVALLVGVCSVVMFANAWQKLAQSYALSNLDLSIKNFEALKEKRDLSESWALEFRDTNPEWFQRPENVSDSAVNKFSNELRDAIVKTHLEEGTFQVELPLTEQIRENYLISFRKFVPDDQTPAVIQAVGIAMSASLMRLSPWAAPFLSVVLVALLVAGIFSFAVSHKLNAVYETIGNALGHIGTGRLKNIEMPKTSDPSVQKLVIAMESTIKLLSEKDTKIAQVSTLANEDPMTGVPNYRAFEKFMDGLMSGVFVPTTVPVLGIIDLDHFKKINDTHGHQVGDFVLKETTRIITESIRFDSNDSKRSPDFFARYGGEEFVVIFTSVRTDSIHVGAERILKHIKAAKLIVPAEISETKKSFELSISASIGLSVWDRKTFSREDWVKDADQALYDAKHSGRGRIVQLKPTRREWT